MTELTKRLTVAEADFLAQCEETISAGLHTFREVGQALAAVRDNRLYRAQFGTFDEYCAVKWDLTDRRARQLIDAAAIGTMVPVENERQARALSAVPETERADVWRETVNRTDGKPTAAAIAKTYAATRPETPARRDPEPTQGEPAIATTGGPVTASIPEPERVEQKPNRRPLPDAFRDGAYDLVKVVERLERLVLDDRFPRNAEQVARTCRHDLLRAVDLLAAVVDRIPDPTKESTE